LWHRQGLFIE